MGRGRVASCTCGVCKKCKHRIKQRQYNLESKKRLRKKALPGRIMARVRGGKWGFHAAVEDEKARVWLVEKLVPEDPPSILGPSSLVRGAWVEEGVLRQIEEEEEWRWWRAWEEEKTEDGKWAGRGCRSAKMFDWARPYRYRFQRADMADLSVTRWKWGTG